MAWIVLILCGEAVGCTFMRVDIVADESTHNDGCSVLNANGSSCTLATRNDLGINGEPDNIKSSIILSSNPLLGHASSLNFLMAPYADPPRPLGKELFVNAVVKGQGFAPARRRKQYMGVRYATQRHLQNMELPEGFVDGDEWRIASSTAQWEISIAANPSVGVRNWIHDYMVALGGWHEFALSVTPHDVGDGAVKVCENGNLTNDRTHFIIGYKPGDPVNSTEGDLLNGFDVEVGLCPALRTASLRRVILMNCNTVILAAT